MPTTTNGITTPTTGDEPNVPADLLTMAGTIHTKVQNAQPRAVLIEEGGIGNFGVAQAGGTSAMLLAKAFTMPAQGAMWVEFEVGLMIGRGDNAATAGLLYLTINGTNRRTLRWTSQGRTSHVMACGTGVAGPYAAGATVSFNVSIAVDAPSATVGWLDGFYAIRRVSSAA